jgi:hypothetical protein
VQFAVCAVFPPTAEKHGVVMMITLVVFSKFSPSTAGSHFQRTCVEKLKLLHFSSWKICCRCADTRYFTKIRKFEKTTRVKFQLKILHF